MLPLPPNGLLLGTLPQGQLTLPSPHHTQELCLYGDFISSEFSAKLPSSHPRVILFDIAIWNTVQGGHRYRLTNCALHLQFYSAILMPNRVEANAPQGANRQSNQSHAGGSKTDICNQFNTPNGCPSCHILYFLSSFYSFFQVLFIFLL